ncbi:MAG: efflux RND transporter periplasmic adaptor subunit [Bacteriovoracaceae bacterium]|nr:efflux RND transporter periplasmic adaptor subunit [Bacteriovoracaceae bacterium]
MITKNKNVIKFLVHNSNQSGKFIFAIGLIIFIGITLQTWIKKGNSTNNFDYITQVISENVQNFPINLTGKILVENEIDYFFAGNGGVIEQIYFRPGDKVKQGDLLAKLQNAPETEDIINQYEKLKNKLNDLPLLESRLASLNKDLKHKMISYDEYLKNKLIIIDAIQTTLNLQKEIDKLNSQTREYKIFAQEDGIVTAVFHKPGNVVLGFKDLPILSVAPLNGKKYVAEVELFDYLVNQIEQGNQALVEISNLTGQKFKGKVRSINQKATVELKSRYYAAIIDLEIPSGMEIPAEIRLEAEIYKKKQDNLFWIPKNAFELNFNEKQISKTLDLTKKKTPSLISDTESNKKDVQTKESSISRELANDARIKEIPTGIFYILTTEKKIVRVKVEIASTTKNWIGVNNQELKNVMAIVHYSQKN